jgi:diaminohydroxyphosphoribosylaminopyrimidine deaminase/5-amino-6-(5-phosphoribosylamino)uracil reductase
VSEPAERLVTAGVTVLRVSEKDGRPDLAAALDALSAHQRERLRARVVQVRDEAALDKLLSLIGGVLIEGGGQVAASFIEAGLVDAVEWFRAPIVLGDEGRPAIGGFVLKELSGAPRFRRVAVEALGDDLWERYERV